MKVKDALGREIDLIVRSARLPYEGPSGAPPSRGARCESPGAGAQAPCSLTDGNFSKRFDPAACTPPSPCSKYVLVDLGKSIPVNLVVLRGCDGTCTVEVSRDNKTWRKAGTTPQGGPNVAVPVQGTPATRFVRVTSSTTIAALTEISVWDPAKPGATKSILTDVPGNLPPLQRVIERASKAPILIAAALAALLLGLLGGIALRRRS